MQITITTPKGKKVKVEVLETSDTTSETVKIEINDDDDRSFQIYVRSLAGKTITLQVRRSDTTDNLKAKIKHVEGIPTKDQCLYFDGKRLADGTTLADYNIKDGVTVHLALRQPGG